MSSEERKPGQRTSPTFVRRLLGTAYVKDVDGMSRPTIWQGPLLALRRGCAKVWLEVCDVENRVSTKDGWNVHAEGRRGDLREDLEGANASQDKFPARVGRRKVSSG